MVEVEKDNTRGIAVGGLTTGIIGSALGLLNNGSFGSLIGGCNNGCNNGGSSYVTRYDAEKDGRIAALETEVKLRDANTYTLNEMNKMRNYVDAKFDSINAQMCTQAVVNAQVTANLSCLQNTVATLSGLTKTIIPITNVCPEPMAMYNSWTAPTAGTTTGA
jgi:hypothetical protein